MTESQVIEIPVIQRERPPSVLLDHICTHLPLPDAPPMWGQVLALLATNTAANECFERQLQALREWSSE